ncbi:hypothetical protein CBR_g38611 [Chara braunii]|uniref:Uncharacterized protein n=1 Tax=Chara braunii TaxID=69332 RepID=A0A388K0Q9_CHABU|nr:hypothetical protein CBR_g38611 [Chara braunii]|eukprot:GBG63543.1 hypothetical protein CBR_g38611 [Chara braunii]
MEGRHKNQSAIRDVVSPAISPDSSDRRGDGVARKPVSLDIQRPTITLKGVMLCQRPFELRGGSGRLKEQPPPPSYQVQTLRLSPPSAALAESRRRPFRSAFPPEVPLGIRQKPTIWIYPRSRLTVVGEHKQWLRQFSQSVEQCKASREESENSKDAKRARVRKFGSKLCRAILKGKKLAHWRAAHRGGAIASGNGANHSESDGSLSGGVSRFQDGTTARQQGGQSSSCSGDLCAKDCNPTTVQVTCTDDCRHQTSVGHHPLLRGNVGGNDGHARAFQWWKEVGHTASPDHHHDDQIDDHDQRGHSVSARELTLPSPHWGQPKEGRHVAGSDTSLATPAPPKAAKEGRASSAPLGHKQQNLRAGFAGDVVEASGRPGPEEEQNAFCSFGENNNSNGNSNSSCNNSSNSTDQLGRRNSTGNLKPQESQQGAAEGHLVVGHVCDGELKEQGKSVEDPSRTAVDCCGSFGKMQTKKAATKLVESQPLLSQAQQNAEEIVGDQQPRGRRKGKQKPKWAMTKEEIEEEEDAEVENLLSFVRHLDYDRFLEMSEMELYKSLEDAIAKEQELRLRGISSSHGYGDQQQRTHRHAGEDSHNDIAAAANSDDNNGDKNTTASDDGNKAVAVEEMEAHSTWAWESRSSTEKALVLKDLQEKIANLRSTVELGTEMQQKLGPLNPSRNRRLNALRSLLAEAQTRTEDQNPSNLVPSLWKIAQSILAKIRSFREIHSSASVRSILEKNSKAPTTTVHLGSSTSSTAAPKDHHRCDLIPVRS